MRAWTRLLSRIGEGRAVGGIGALYVTLAVGWNIVQFGQGVPVVSRLVLSLLIAVPGIGLVYGGLWLLKAEIDPDLHADVVGWCLAGLIVMSASITLYRLQPGSNLMAPAASTLILTAIGAVAGLAVGIYDGRAKMRSRQLSDQDEELRRAQTELEDTINRLEESNDRLERHTEYTEHVLDSIRDIFYVIDEDGSLERWNESLREVTGYTDEQIDSASMTAFFTDDERSRIADAVVEGFETGSTQVEASLLTADGEAVPYEFDASTLQNPEGETVLAGIGRNVSERAERECELQQRARQQQVVADLGQLALEADDLDTLMADAARQVADVLDNEYCKLLDLDEERGDLLLRQGVGWDEGIVGEATVSANEADSQAAYTLENNHPIVVENLAREERFGGPDLLTDHDVRSGISTIIGPFDDPWGILGTHDTEIRRYTEKDVIFVQSVANIIAAAIEREQYQGELEELVADLEASNERLEQFAYAASHDMREPLRMVSSYLQLLDRRYGDDLDEEATEYIEFAVDGADRMRKMIDRLLRYSRIETEGAPLEPVDLNEVIADVREDLRVTIEESDASITVNSLPQVCGDPNQLRQLFQNLIDNAIEYSGDAPPAVEIRAERDDAWTITVSDDGIGIDPDDQERIFEVFERAHGRRQSAGSGIGLALCQRIVERHGGDIRVESRPGEGATFSFPLPAADGTGDGRE